VKPLGLLLGWIAFAAAGEGMELVAEVPKDLPRVGAVRALTSGPKHHFFGYYAICPWNTTGRYVACMETDFSNRMPEPGERARICLVDTETGAFERIAETTAWNFQQGALVHWLGEREIVYNDVVDGRLRAVVVDVFSGERRALPRAVTSVAHNGKTAACISFGRLNTTRPGYGYPGVEDLYADEPHPEEDGLFVMDLDTGESTLVASLDDVFHAAPLPDEHAGAAMWINLVIMSRDDQHVAFLGRYRPPGSKGWRTALFTVNVDGTELRCVLPYDWGCSHFDWVDAERLVATTRYQGKVGGHVLFTNGKDDYRLLAPDVLKHDGHCHASPDGRWMVTDSYPLGPSRMQRFYAMDLETEAIALLARFHEPRAFHGQWRCDLHPRWSRDGVKVCIDSTHEGSRQVYVLDLEFPEERTPEAELWAEAEANAARAHEAFSRSRRVMHAWYGHQGKANALLPDRLDNRIWRPENAAADLWSFLILAAHFTDRDLFEGVVQQTLEDEIRLTTRLGRLPDDFNIDAQTFERRDADLDNILFGASEYVKDGLLPVTEVLGRTAWFERARELLDDIFRYARVETPFGRLPSSSAEVCGEMLQSLSRFYFATGDERYKAWAERIGDAYFLDMMPKNNGLPCHGWDFDASKATNDLLSLSDHGNEIVFGLAELLALEHACDPAKFEQYLPPMRRMLDTLLEVAVNEHGLWVHSIRTGTLEVANAGTPDTWGYALNAVYTFYLLTGEAKYREAVRRALRGINADVKYRAWGGADAFADSIEGGIVLLNRIPEPEGFAWLEATVSAFLAKQREDGIVEAWYGDGNSVRTALMYALMKTQGAYVTPWREDVRIGAMADAGALRVHVAAAEPWEGVVRFDYPRHRMHFGLPLNYPRLNEFPEWYVLEPTRLYKVAVDGQTQGVQLGDRLIKGLPLELDASQAQIVVRPLPGPPYGERALRIEAVHAHGGEGPFRIPVVVHNDTGEAQSVRLTTSFGVVEPAAATIDVDGRIEALLTGDLKESGQAIIEVVSSQGALVSHRIRMICEAGLVGFQVFEHETYKGQPYRWTGHGEIEFSLPAHQDKAHTLHVLWGAKRDQRAGVVTVNGHAQRVVHGGYDGFEWVTVHVPAAWVTEDTIDIAVTGASNGASKAFIAEAKLTR